jgi:predicted transcriptional regulator
MLSALKGVFMATAKEVMVGIIQDQPEDSSFDELLREPAIKRMVDRGLDDARKGKTITNEDMERRIRSWQK